MKEITVIPLGTISPYPKGEKNNPGYLLKSGEEKLLLDCGNGITRYLSFPEDLQNLTLILTHLHKDHIGDVGALQYASYTHNNLGSLTKKVKMYLPKNDFNHSKQSMRETQESYMTYHDIEQKNKEQIGPFELTFYNNNTHPIETYMVGVKVGKSKIVYTSDMGPNASEEVIDFCKDSDLLIAESFYLKSHHANSKVHLTAFDAANLARLSKSKTLLLTHFWPEEDPEKYLLEAQEIFQNSFLAKEKQKIWIRR